MSDKNMPVRIYGEQEKATYTENYNLKKPDQEDFYNIQDHNDNMDKIDGAFSNLNKSDVGLGNVDNTSDADKHVKWGNIDEKPQTFPPGSHNHDSEYYKKSEIQALFPVKTILVFSSTGGPGFHMPFGTWTLLFTRTETVIDKTFDFEYWRRDA